MKEGRKEQKTEGGREGGKERNSSTEIKWDGK